jgi:hypothetical protein
MSLLDRAIASARKLPQPEQDLAAAYLMEYCSSGAFFSQAAVDEAREAYAEGDLAFLTKWRKLLGIAD